MVKQTLILLALNPSPILDLMERTLYAANFDVAIALDRAGLDKSVQEAIPALMIIGEKFADGDGLSISSEMLERFPTLPIILYAEKDTSGLAKAVLKAGLSNYLYPPLKMADIVDEVQKSLTRARTLGDWLRREVKRTTSSLEEKAKIFEAERVKLEAIIANIQNGVIVMDENHTILFVNHAIQDIFHLNKEAVAGKQLKDVITNADLHALLSRSGEESVKYHEINFDDGRMFNAQYTPIPKIGAAVTLQDISYFKELDRLKNDFIHTVSHDLRSPLTAILGYTELLERTGPLNQNQQEFLRRLQESIRHITSLINDLLDLGRLEAGFDIRREYVQLESVLKYILNMFDAQIKNKKLNLTMDIAENMPALHVNPLGIRQMLDNLIGNAIKYTPEGGSIRVYISTQNKQTILKIEDTGLGILPEEQTHVFEKFYRASNAPDNVEGSGLGLAIVKSIVDRHQGRVWVESTTGGGSTFTVLLPS